MIKMRNYYFGHGQPPTMAILASSNFPMVRHGSHDHTVGISQGIRVLDKVVFDLKSQEPVAKVS